MKKTDPETKKKRVQALLKVLLVAAILGISVLLSRFNLVHMGHDFVMKFFSFLDVKEEDEQELYTIAPDGQNEENPSSSPAPSASPDSQTPSGEGGGEETLEHINTEAAYGES